MKHSSSPAYSIGIKYSSELKTTNKLSPSPDTYNIRPKDISVPSTRFSKAPKLDSNPKSISPGPGAYTLSSFVDMTLTKPKGKTPKPGKSKNDQSKVETPGPASYNPSKPKTMISYTIGNKLFGMQTETLSLGPGYYNPKMDSIFPVKSNTISKSPRDISFIRSDLPGPGHYEISPIRESPKHGFGKEQRIKEVVGNFPAPGQYNINDIAEAARKKMGKTMLPKRKLLNEDNKIPGPGAYSSSYRNESPSFTIGKGKRKILMVLSKIPGPGTYTPTSSPSKSPGKTIGTALRPSINQKSLTPGPGAYETLTYTSSGPKYTLKGRKEKIEETCSSPGPGHYEPDINSIKSDIPHAIIGTDKRIIGLKPGNFNVPGPGTYESKSQTESPIWTFKKAPRDQTIYEEDPGPGHYTISSSIPGIPN
ncbi:hypothetical protein SteCoe_1040 [Stentor coeruleus]|uniref:Outer dense fiber protein 3 n=1 Tax=Stentor coeruleus TaxID=5963 RepID=A0A1R2D311_9CILI|nr:hypothetical protein SteCoe_1040 [Stentor coeruleus]